MTQSLRINGRLESHDAATLAELLTSRGIDPEQRFLAVAVNGSVIRRSEWAECRLAPGDEIEIVRPLQGG
jgi:sulfur carrier protein